jgi:NADPH-dependent 2,4-dienoyl-CoA reductase/sulfur reductase-like enzyme
MRNRTFSSAPAVGRRIWRRVVTMDSGDGVSFDSLLIATGASPVHLDIPGADLPNVFYLRTLEDADRLLHAIDKARAEGLRNDGGGRGRVVVIGGGMLGIELSSTLTKMGLAVELVVAGPHPLHRFAGDHAGRFLQRHLESSGVIVHANSAPLRLEGDGRVQRVVLEGTNASPRCDLVIAAIGVASNRELLRGTSINAEKAILVDERCRTNIEGIFAAGDCAAVFDTLFGKHRMLDHWDSASITGAIAGTNMAGGEARYDDVSHFASEAFGLKLSAWGEPKFVDRRLIRGSTSADAPDFVEIGIAADGRIAQVLAVNHGGEDELLRKLVAKRAAVEGFEESLKDPASDLRRLL